MQLFCWKTTQGCGWLTEACMERSSKRTGQLDRRADDKITDDKTAPRCAKTSLRLATTSCDWSPGRSVADGQSPSAAAEAWRRMAEEENLCGGSPSTATATGSWSVFSPELMRWRWWWWRGWWWWRTGSRGRRNSRWPQQTHHFIFTQSIDQSRQTIKQHTSATYGYRPKSVTAVLGCGVGCAPGLSVTTAPLRWHMRQWRYIKNLIFTTVPT